MYRSNFLGTLIINVENLFLGVIENFRSASFFLNGRKQGMRHRIGVNRGHKDEIAHFLEVVRGGPVAPVPVSESIYTALTIFAIERSLEDGSVAKVSFQS